MASPPDTQTLLNQLQGVGATNRDAYAALTTLFDSYGLSSLAPKILDYLQQGYGADTISVLLQSTPEYQARFAGNQQRIDNGLAVLTPAEYLSTEASYKQIIQAAGLDPSLADQSTTDEWIGKDISPTEIQSRANLAISATSQASPWVQQAFTDLGIKAGDVAGFFLNDNNALPDLQMTMAQAQIMGAGGANGLQTNKDQAMTFAEMGVTQAQALSGYQRIAALLPAAEQLSTIYSSQPWYGQAEAENEFLGSSGEMTAARQRLGNQEVAAFTGQGGVGDKTFKPQGQPVGF